MYLLMFVCLLFYTVEQGAGIITYRGTKEAGLDNLIKRLHSNDYIYRDYKTISVGEYSTDHKYHRRETIVDILCTYCQHPDSYQREDFVVSQSVAKRHFCHFTGP